MKNRFISSLAILSLGFICLTSCNKDREPAVTMSGNYTGSFEGVYMGNDTVTNSGYKVQITAENDNKVRVTGNDFDEFTVLVTSNGLNVEPVSQSDPYLLDFIYIADESKVKFTYNKDDNEAEFIGTK
ncbi:hypothetical protein N8987_05560 [Crocinitomix sp.]|nr:hypothetical protein [Crocinitomix sp.]